jgi:hypothetical protein
VTDILLLALIVAAPGVLILGWLAFLMAAADSVVASDATEVDDLSLLSRRRGRPRPSVAALPG